MAGNLKIGTTDVGGIAITDNRDYSDPVVSPWVRNTNWVDMPSIATGDSKFVGLYGVVSGKENYVAFTVENSHYVDWGDGNTEYFANGTVANHQFNFNDISGSTQFTGDHGEIFRQALVTVTPSGAEVIDNFTLFGDHPDLFAATSLYGGNANWLDIKVNFPDVTNLEFRSLDFQYPYLENIHIQNIDSLTTFQNMFYSCYNLRNITCDADTSNITSWSSTFYNCNKIQSLAQLNIKGAASLYQTFYGCRHLVELPADLTGVVSTNMQNAFRLCHNLEEIPVFDTSSATQWDYAFSDCFSLKELPALDSSSATDVQYIFDDCRRITKIPDSYNFSNVTNASNAFRVCQLTEFPTGVLALGKATNLSYTFGYNYILQNAPEVDTSSCEQFDNMFVANTSLENVPLLDTSAGIDFVGMFSSCHALKTIPHLDTSNGTRFYRMFENCFSLTGIPSLSSNSLTNAAAFFEMFQLCYSLIEIPESIFTGASPTQNLTRMCESCWSLTHLPDSFSNLQPTIMTDAFQDCYCLLSVPHLDMSNSSNNDLAFNLCQGLEDFGGSGAVQGFTLRRAPINTDKMSGIFENLGTVSSEIIDIRNTYALSGMNADIRAIATSKGWTITE